MDIVELLGRQGMRMTSARERVVRAMPLDNPFRADELWRIIHDAHPDVGRATVFRTLGLLLDLGVLERLDDGDGIHRYRLCTACADGHHHHLTCLKCGQDAILSGADLQPLEQALSQAQAKYGFVPTGHQLQLFGRCARCR